MNVCVSTRKSTYFVWDVEIFECDPCALDKGTKTTAEKCDVLVCGVALDGLKGLSGALVVVGLSGVGHDGSPSQVALG